MRTLILSDIHGNLEALEAVLATAGNFDAVWNLGDVVGYGASPNEVVERIRPIATRNIRGNHDRVCGGTTSASTFNPAARDAAMWTKEQLSAHSLAWLGELTTGPVNIDVPGYGAVALAHGSPIHEDIYIVNIRDAWEPLQQMQQQITFFGHTHIQGGFGSDDGRWFDVRPKHAFNTDHSQWTLTLEPNRKYLLNPGSVGQPRDGDPRAAYAVFDSDAKIVTFHREAYDIDLAQGRILLAGLPEKLAKRLREGR